MANKADLFAPLSKEERAALKGGQDLFAPLSAEELKAIRGEKKERNELPEDKDFSKTVQYLDKKYGNYADLPQEMKKGAEYLGEKYNSFFTSPARAVHGAIAEGKSPMMAAIRQIGQSPAKAPTGSELMQKHGVSNEPVAKFSIMGREFNPSLADIGGEVLNIVEDPLLLSGPLFKAAKFGGKVAKGALSLGRDAVIAGADLLTGGEYASRAKDVVGRGLEFAGNAASGSFESLAKVFNPSQSVDFPEMMAIAQKYGIDPRTLPEGVEFGKGTFLDSAGRSLREGHLNEHHMQLFKENYEKLSQGVAKEIQQIGGGAPPLSVQEAGTALRHGFDEGIQRFWDGIEMTHNEVQKYAPGLYIDREAMAKLDSTVNGIEKFAKGQVSRGITAMDKGQGQELLNAVDAFRQGNGSYKQSVEALRQIGREAFRTQNVLQKMPSDVEKLRKLYFAVDEALIDTVAKHVNPAFAEELVSNNKLIHKMFTERSQIGGVLGDSHVAPEHVFKRLIENGDSDQIKALKTFLTPEQMNQQKAAFLNDMVKLEPDGSFNLKNLYNKMRSKKQQLSNLFSEDPGQLIELSNALKLGERFGNPVLSSSGTGASNVFKDLSKEAFSASVANESIVNSLKERARNPQKALAAPSPVISPKMGAKALGVYEDSITRKLNRMKQ
jgi:hypothetical protein